MPILIVCIYDDCLVSDINLVVTHALSVSHALFNVLSLLVSNNLRRNPTQEDLGVGMFVNFKSLRNRLSQLSCTLHREVVRGLPSLGPEGFEIYEHPNAQ